MTGKKIRKLKSAIGPAEVNTTQGEISTRSQTANGTTSLTVRKDVTMIAKKIQATGIATNRGTESLISKATSTKTDEMSKLSL